MERFSGANELPPILATLVTLVIGVALIWVVPAPWSWWIVGPIALVVVAVATGSRYQVTVDDTGVRVVFRRLWVVPVKRIRYLLDASAALYESAADFQPIGVCLEPYSWTPETFPACFCRGRPLPDLERIHDEIQAAILRARVEVVQRELRGPLASFAGALELDDKARGIGGRFIRARTTAPIEIGGVCIPEGSTLELNDEDEWLDPRRDDRLRSVALSRPTWVPAISHELSTRARLVFDDQLAYISLVVFAGEVEVDGFVCAGCWGIGFGPDDELTHFTLAAPWTIPTCTLPADAYFSATRRRDGDHFWAVKLSESLSLPGVGLRQGDKLYINADGSLVSFFRSRGCIRVGDQEIECGVLAIPLTPAGHVDLIACKRRGVPIKAC